MFITVVTVTAMPLSDLDYKTGQSLLNFPGKGPITAIQTVLTPRATEASFANFCINFSHKIIHK